MPPIAQEIDAAIQSLPREYGGNIDWHLVPGGVEVMVSDHRDVSGVKKALTPIVHQLLGAHAKITVKVVAGGPSGNGRVR